MVGPNMWLTHSLGGNVHNQSPSHGMRHKINFGLTINFDKRWANCLLVQGSHTVEFLP